MYPHVILASQYFSSIKVPTVLKKEHDNMLPIEQLFRLSTCKICVLGDFYFPVLLEQSSDKSNFHFNKTSIEAQRSVDKAYQIVELSL